MAVIPSICCLVPRLVDWGARPIDHLCSRHNNKGKTLAGIEYLFETINHEHTLADTIFQAIIDVEKGLWNVSQPDKVAP